MSHILVVEDKQSLREMMKKTLETEGYQVETTADGISAVNRLSDRRYVLVLTDLKLPGADGIAVLRAARQSDPDVPVIVMTAYGTVENAVAAMKQGALDYLTKPVDMDHLLLLIKRSVEQRRLQFENILLKEIFAAELGFPQIIGEETGLRDVIDETKKVAATDTTVLITGESGTGKELIARAIHHLSVRRDRAFVAVNCAAIPDTLLESELFGHEKGSFTGAVNQKKGKFELAEAGSIFLDEIGELSASIQAKILRVLQEKTYERVGGTETRHADVRIITATNKVLSEQVAQKAFRQDLFFRLNIFPIHLPPLRERVGDIPLLARTFVARFAKDVRQMGNMRLSDEALSVLLGHTWPGNVRELENYIERAVILSPSAEIPASLFDLRVEGEGETDAGSEELFDRLVGLQGSLQQAAARAAAMAERIKIRRALKKNEGVRSRAAESLQVSQKTLLAKIREYGFEEFG